MESPAVSGIFHLAAAQAKENEQVSKINALVTGGTFMRILLVVVKSNWIFGGRSGSRIHVMVVAFQTSRHEGGRPSSILQAANWRDTKSTEL